MKDLTTVSPLNESTVLQAVEDRYKSGEYHTWAGVPLVVVNPFQDIAGLYSDQLAEKYKNGPKELPPHIFAVGQKAYTDLRRDLDARNQSIIISGESGAGKTWNTRHLMKYLTDAAEKRFTSLVKSDAAQMADSEESLQCIREIEQRILDSNPVLEAFGNAQTLRNENSSRFGKYIQLHYDRQSHIIGASIQTYLLEKTRVACPAEGERNFHIFCQMFPEKPDATHEALKVTKTAMRNIGIQDGKQAEIFKILRGIRHLCELKFTAPATHNDPCVLEDGDKVDAASSLLGVRPERLIECFTFRKISAGPSAELFVKPCTATECKARRSCMAKLLYSSLFEWIVACINKSIEAPEESRYSFIGLLDIYGFESFRANSLEQLCINYANEKLQQHFVYHFLKKQQEEYRKECVEWDFQEFVDNRPCLDLIEGRISVFSLMNEECRLQRSQGTEVFGDRLVSSLSATSSHFSRPRVKGDRCEFIIHHFADSVCYQVDGLIEKNKDQIPSELEELLESSSSWLLQEFAATRKTEDAADNAKDSSCDVRGAKRRTTSVTVVAKFKTSLDSLMSTLRSTSAHYIRCIKPNSLCQPEVFDRKQVFGQLKACGVVETIRISAAGYPVRMTHREFIRRYSILMRYLGPASHVTKPPVAHDVCSPAIQSLRRESRRARRRRRSACDHMVSLCTAILDSAGPITEVKENLAPQTPRGVTVGRTKIYLREEEMERLEAHRSHCVSRAAFSIQCCWRRYKRNTNRKRNQAATNIQAALRCWLATTRYRALRKAVEIIQRYARRHLRKKETERRALERKETRREHIQPSLQCHVAEICPKPSHSLPRNSPESSPMQPRQSDKRACGPSQSPTCAAMTQAYHMMSYGRIGQKPCPLALWKSGISSARSGRFGALNFAADDRESMSRLMCHGSLDIASVRRIEKVPVAFHCRGTPLPYASTRPRDSALDKGLADLSSLLWSNDSPPRE